MSLDLPSSPWLHGPLLGFDTETTGVSPTSDRLVTAALVRMEGLSNAAAPAPSSSGTPLPSDAEPGAQARPVSVRTWLADPGVEIPTGAAAVHGISTEKARADGAPIEQVLEEVASELVQALHEGTPVVVFNASFDLTLMESELARHGLPTLRERLGTDSIGPVLDPLVLDRAMDRYRKGKRNLEAMARVYGVSVPDDLHTAEVDVATTLHVLIAMTTAYPELARKTLENLQSYQAGAHKDWAANFNSWLARQGRPPDVDLAWPLTSTLT